MSSGPAHRDMAFAHPALCMVGLFCPPEFGGGVMELHPGWVSLVALTAEL